MKKNIYLKCPHLFLILFLLPQMALAIVGVPDDKRFIDCQRLYRREFPTDYSDFRKVRPRGLSIIHVCFDTQANEKVVIKAATGRTISTLRNEALFYRLTFEIPSVIKQYGTFSDENWRYEVLEYGSNGDLYSEVDKKGHFSEDEALFWFRQIAQAIFELHQLKIVHLDIKLDNFFLKGRSLKIGDFGLSEYLASHPPTYKKKGSLNTMAPEILNRKFNGTYDPYAADIYSVGSTLFTMLTGEYPFKKAHASDLRYCYIRDHKVSGLLKIHNPVKDLSPTVLDLLDQLMEENPKKRPTSEQILNHPWLRLKELPFAIVN